MLSSALKVCGRTVTASIYLVAGGRGKVPGCKARFLKDFFCRCLLTPAGRSTNPAMFLQLRVQRTWERPLVTGADVGLNVADLAHAGDDRGDIRIVQNKAQSHFGHI